MEEYACVNCGWKYDKDDFKQIDESFKCPKCGTEKRKFMTLRRLEDNQDVKVIEAHYDRMGEWKMDPKGFFTIKIFPEEGLIKVRYYKTIRKIECLIEGKTAMDIFNTIIREGFRIRATKSRDSIKIGKGICSGQSFKSLIGWGNEI